MSYRENEKRGYLMFDKKSIEKNALNSEWLTDILSNPAYKVLRSLLVRKFTKLFTGKHSEKIGNGTAVLTALIPADIEVRFRLVDIGTVESFQWYGDYWINIFTGKINRVDFKGISEKNTSMILTENTKLQMGVFNKSTGELLYTNDIMFGFRELQKNGFSHLTIQDVNNSIGLPLRNARSWPSFF